MWALWKGSLCPTRLCLHRCYINNHLSVLLLLSQSELPMGCTLGFSKCVSLINAKRVLEMNLWHTDAACHLMVKRGRLKVWVGNSLSSLHILTWCMCIHAEQSKSTHGENILFQCFIILSVELHFALVRLSNNTLMVIFKLQLAPL